MASSNLISELVWHFAGYFRVSPDDNFTVKVIYDGGEEAAVKEDNDAGPGHHARPHDADLPPPAQMHVPVIPPADPYHWSLQPIHRFHFPHQSAHLPPVHPHGVPLLPYQPIIVDGSGGGGGEFQIIATYQSGGDQELIDVRQINLMLNNNVSDNYVIHNVHINAPAHVIAQNESHADHMLQKMLDQANDAVPTNLQLPQAPTDQLKSFVDANDSHPLQTQAYDAPYTFHVGQYVNGSPVTDGSDPHQITNDLFNHVVTPAIKAAESGPPALPTGDHTHDSIVDVSVGSNVAANDAAINNYEGLCTSLVVQGNYYQTEAVVQTNVFAGADHFSGSSTTTISANTIENICDVQNDVPTLTSGGTGTTASGLNWSVDYLNGDLLDIHSLVQTNYLSNNNVIYQTSATGESEIVAGSNAQVNSAQFQNLTAKYDLIVVEGNFHQDDLIYQTNVLLDNNAINFSGLGSQSATGGGDNVINDATIINTGNLNFQQFSSDASAIVQALEHQSGTIDPNAVLNAFPNLFGNINVLVVTGDYYDINYISQTNIMSNSNVVAVGADPAAANGGQQSVSTGQDALVNAASIVDGGSATSPYLQGQYYSDMILLQTNIIGNNPNVTSQDPSKLAPEVVAFTAELDTTHNGQDTSVVASATPQQHTDGVATILH